jgi:hypothetical protein
LRSDLDRPLLLELALKTAVDEVRVGCGPLSARAHTEESLVETLPLENVELHLQVSRLAVTDELAGPANHGQ